MALWKARRGSLNKNLEFYTMLCVKEVRESQDRVIKEEPKTPNIVSHEKSGRSCKPNQ